MDVKPRSPQEVNFLAQVCLASRNSKGRYCAACTIGRSMNQEGCVLAFAASLPFPKNSRKESISDTFTPNIASKFHYYI